MASNDPRFEQKAAAIIGLYLNPPQHAAVFCVDENSAIRLLSDKLSDTRVELLRGSAILEADDTEEDTAVRFI